MINEPPHLSKLQAKQESILTQRQPNKKLLKKTFMKKNFLRFAVSCFTVLAASGSFAQPVITLPAKIDASNSPYLCEAANTYIINGKVVVADGGVLQIEAGTVLKANKILPNTAASALLISRGGTIEAVGSNTNPIVFTSNESVPSSGDWGGIVILGRAPNNRTTNPVIEGIDGTTLPAGTDFNYGPVPATVGGVPSPGLPDESSGVMTYCRIEYAGAAISAANELNGLTLGSVGRGTELDFIQVIYGADDAFEFFGGTVNAKHLVALAPDDDCFDFDFGYSGNLQFCVSLLKPEKPTYSSDPNGIESDNEGTGTANATPRTSPKISNMTVIGFVDSLTAGSTPGVGKKVLNGARWRRQSSYTVRNSIFMGYNTGVLFETALTQGDVNNFQYNVVHGFKTVDGGASIPATNLEIIGNEDFSNLGIELANPFVVGAAPDFRPTFDSPADIKTGANFTGFTGTPASFFQVVPYRGAFPANTNWARIWTKWTDFQ